MDESSPESPAERRAHQKADRRARKTGPRPMKVSGKSVFLIKQLVEQKARAARAAGQAGRRVKRRG